MSLCVKEYLITGTSDTVTLEVHHRLVTAIHQNDEEEILHLLPHCTVLFIIRLLCNEQWSPLLGEGKSFKALFIPSRYREGIAYADLGHAHEEPQLGDALALYTTSASVPHNRELFCADHTTLLLERKDLAFTTEAFATSQRLKERRMRSGCFRLRTGTVVLACVNIHRFKQEALQPYSAFTFEHPYPAYW